MGLVRLFRPERARIETRNEGPSAAPQAVHVGAPAEANDDRLGGVIGQLEEDVLLTMRIIGDTAEKAQAKVEESVSLVDKIRDTSDHLSVLAASAAEVSNRLARTTEQLDATTRSIEHHVAGADSFINEARGTAMDVTASMDRLAQAVDRIAGVLKIIGNIARHTNLLALNAAIEAARAGPAGRGFGVVAAEVKSLANEVQRATGDISAQIGALQNVARQNGVAVGNIASLIGRIEPVLGSIRDAVKAQSADTRDASARAAESATFVRSVASQADDVKSLTGQATTAVRTAGTAGGDMKTAIERFTQRSMVFLRHSTRANRRQQERVPVKVKGILQFASQTLPITTLDISTGGALLLDQSEAIWPGLSGILTVDGIGTMRATVVARSELGLHTRYDSIDADAIIRINDMIARVHEENKPLIKRVQQAAVDICRAFEDGLATGRVKIEELITIDYRPIPDTNPVQYETASLPFYEKALPVILQRHRSEYPRPLFALAFDRNAYVPVHHPEFSLPQRPEDPVWNDLNSRNKRILDRGITLVGARNREPYNLRVYMRHQRDGTPAPIKVISAPIFVKETFWGNVQMGFPL
ncbi:MAG: PilZ domain-containing protein [Methylobacteriaceae bacterium]|nr:PilZ domain-containing protein [Methylobacteriaceae bacterium]